MQATAFGWAAGLWPLIKVVACDVPIELAMYSASVLVNVSTGPQAQLQRVVRCLSTYPGLYGLSSVPPSDAPPPAPS